MIIIFLSVFCVGCWFGLNANVTESAFNLYEICISSPVSRYILLGSCLILMSRHVQMLDKSSIIFRYKDVGQLLIKSITEIFKNVVLLITIFFSGISFSTGMFSLEALLIPINDVILMTLFCSFIYLSFVYVRNYSLISTCVLLLIGAIEVFSDSIFFIKEIFDNYHIRAFFYLPSWKSDYYNMWIIFIFITCLMFIYAFYQYNNKDKLRGKYHDEEE